MAAVDEVAGRGGDGGIRRIGEVRGFCEGRDVLFSVVIIVIVLFVVIVAVSLILGVAS